MENLDKELRIQQKETITEQEILDILNGITKKVVINNNNLFCYKRLGF